MIEPGLYHLLFISGTAPVLYRRVRLLYAAPSLLYGEHSDLNSVNVNFAFSRNMAR